MADDRRLVWDLPLRLFHWLFATCIVASYVTAKLGFDWMQWHFYLGYTTIGLLVFRILWGLFGPRHARFGSFIHNPSAIWLYVKGMFNPDSAPQRRPQSGRRPDGDPDARCWWRSRPARGCSPPMRSSGPDPTIRP